MQIFESMINNQGVNLHVTEVYRDMKQELPLVIIPGLSESARGLCACTGAVGAKAYDRYYHARSWPE
ncbi:hypothetical protein JCM10914A_51550 [Paenibacillus sp. JCM 10914]|uniref:hypothetical protein n=1 Tax=Paenibacillus sp. JCM 10914 TaxID=1236974 RepID=UPI0003CC81CB|nr:hypothetical protein [Paenibacillus sp. JCM 10914]GAE05152.1 hypothetical protein JCM10914_1241 [Paenibacillus sp. JCM 10914]